MLNVKSISISAEAIASGETNIKTSYLTRYIKSLQSNYTTEDSTWQLLQRHFNQITHKKPLETHFSTATTACNQLKNRCFDFLPIDGTRVKLPILKDQAEMVIEIFRSEGLTKKTIRLIDEITSCLLYTSPSPRDATLSRMPSSA